MGTQENKDEIQSISLRRTKRKTNTKEEQREKTNIKTDRLIRIFINENIDR